MTTLPSSFTDSFKAEPYWWDHTPLAESTVQTPPESVDVLVIGSGYTGLHAAIQTARADLSTVVLDSHAAGYGCSSRNGGQISTSIKYNYPALEKKYGEAIARDILTIGKASLDYVGDFVKQENISCSHNNCGRFHGAHTPRAYDAMERELEIPNPVFNSEAFLVTRHDQYRELGTERYYGGTVFPHYASVDPGQYHRGCLTTAQNAGAKIISHCKVTDFTKHPGGHLVQTKKGTVIAKQIIVATNGYTTNLTPWQQRRVIPIGSYIIATDEIEPDLIDKLMPTNRMLTDSRKLVYYYRPSPDRKRILFGGRVSLSETDPVKSATMLRDELLRLFPELKKIQISHSWAGTVAYTFNSLMHCGEQQGVHYAMGYCGSGVGMASYLGRCIGRQVAGTDTDPIPLSQINFPTRPLYTGTPWFLAPSVWLYRMRDRLPW
ncbi:oxidoreductase [Chromatiales bacterium (ex Bugula neritina AB1)]|nr:oxidoreductase [Chromatiales bacterium (ex Bugula neritina AB1)]